MLSPKEIFNKGLHFNFCICQNVFLYFENDDALTFECKNHNLQTEKLHEYVKRTELGL